MRLRGWARAALLAAGCCFTASCADSPTGESAQAPFVLLAASGAHTCGMTRAGAVSCWGANAYGQLGNGTTEDSAAPLPLAEGRVMRSVATGYTPSCAVGGNAAAYCWGDNTYGQVGSGLAASSTTPVGVLGGHPFRSVTTGAAHTCALTADGAAYCWGSNRAGQLGDGSQTSRMTPAPVVGGVSFRSLSAGGFHTCGLTADGVAYCWGDNLVGEVGVGVASPPHPEPVEVAGNLRFRSVSAGYRFTCAVTDAGAAYCWGDAVSGQLGAGPVGERCSARAYPCSTVPLAVAGGLGFRSVSAGGFHACGITVDGSTSCWGDNVDGQLGAGPTAEVCYSEHPCSTTPVRLVSAEPFASVSAGYLHSCGLATSAVAYCWGENSLGQLGDGSRIRRVTPVRVSGQL